MCAFYFCNLTFCRPRGLSSTKRTLPPKDTAIIPLNWKVRVLPSHFGLFLFLNQKAKKGITMLTGMIDPDYWGEIWLLLHSRGKDKYIWNTGDTLGYLSLSPYPVIRLMENCNNCSTGRTSNGPDPSGINIWVTLPSKEPQPVEVLAECKGNPEWIEMRVIINNRYNHTTTNRNEYYNCYE